MIIDSCHVVSEKVDSHRLREKERGVPNKTGRKKYRKRCAKQERKEEL